MKEPEVLNIGTVTVNFTESDIREMLDRIGNENEDVFTWTFPLDNNAFNDIVTLNITVGEDEN